MLVTVRVAQWIARLPPKQKVAGSNPASDVFLDLLTPPPLTSKFDRREKKRHSKAGN